MHNRVARSHQENVRLQQSEERFPNRKRSSRRFMNLREDIVYPPTWE